MGDYHDERINSIFADVGSANTLISFLSLSQELLSIFEVSTYFFRSENCSQGGRECQSRSNLVDVSTIACRYVSNTSYKPRSKMSWEKQDWKNKRSLKRRKTSEIRGNLSEFSAPMIQWRPYACGTRYKRVSYGHVCFPNPFS